MNWIYYLAEANLYMVAFYVLYVLLLRSVTHYQLNRAYLLITSALSFIIPLMQLGILKPVMQIQTTANISIDDMGSVAPFPMMTQAPVVAQSPIIAEAPKWTTEEYILLAYGIVVLILLINLCIRIYLLVALSKKGSVQKNEGFNLIELHQGSVAFSFFNNLFIDDRFASSQTILHHEQVHIRQKHSWDIIYLELLKIVNWFNPIIYLVIAAMKELHEFIADEQTVRLESNNDAYTDFLISNAFGIKQNPLTNSFFNKNLLKRRIVMLYQKKSGKAAKFKYLMALPLICGLLCLSTMAFTTKTYGWIDLAPQHPLQALKNIAKRVSAPVLQADPVASQPTTPALSNPAPVSAKNENTNPIIVVDGKVFTKPIPADFNFATAADAEYAKLLGIDTKDIKSISVLKTAVATARYGQQGANGVLIITTNNAAIPAIVADTPKTNQIKVTDVLLTAPSHQVTSVVLTPSSTPPTVVDPNNPNIIFTAVEVNPQFTGGETAFGKFLIHNIHYPADDKKNGVQGRVYINFVVERDGSLSDAKIVRAPSEAMGEEALRIIKLSPNWTPGIQNGKPVRVSYTVPINFSLPGTPIKDVNNMPYNSRNTKVLDQHVTPGAAELIPVFKGGDEAFTKFLQDNLVYPAKNKAEKIQGTVYVKLIVDKDGALSDFEVVRSPSAAMSTEAVRVLKLSSPWAPGTQNYTAARLQCTVPITFALPPAIIIDPNNPNPIFLSVEVAPKFPGGMTAFASFLAHNIRYPKADHDNNVQGRVYARFVVEPDGSLSNIKIVRTPSDAMSAEALRVLQLSPSWVPGVQNGRPVRVQYMLPINFSLGDDSPSNINALYKFIRSNARYPQDAKAAKTEGRVYVQFRVDENKQIQNIKAIKSAAQSFSDEVIRLLQSFKTISDGTAGYTYTMPVMFNLSNGKPDASPSNTPPANVDYKAGADNRVALNEVVVTGYY